MQYGELGLGNHFVECRGAGFLPRQTRGSGIVFHVCVCVCVCVRERGIGLMCLCLRLRLRRCV